ncbi:hypothetical protein BN890_10160 [Bacteroides xylanisolvens SD CC 1b]|uniref:Uncharacterized protein n=1 Tax=Bacteroides xylanisolvens SD CC 1b TaxID=702447 RepID=W6P131_9BACE|nr:hypothetical protein BN891_45360 [Bacteroides xylanisolvens SD CC 2a]CDM03463.1 hypothetical protein BN890_10160 [Bacteroides xylanisolvens SD CC 1b]
MNIKRKRFSPSTEYLSRGTLYAVLPQASWLHTGGWEQTEWL